MRLTTEQAAVLEKIANALVWTAGLLLTTTVWSMTGRIITAS